MKKRFMSLLAVAATLSVGFSSCNNDNDAVIENVQDKSVSLKVITGKTGARAEEISQSGERSTIDPNLRAAVYFLDAANSVTDYFEIKPDTSSSITAEDIKVSDLNGYKFNGISGNASNVYILANISASVTDIPTGPSITEIEALQLNIIDFTEIKKVTMNGIGEIIGSSPSYTANVRLTPVVARFEIASVEYDATHLSSITNALTKFELKGIFVNNHHKTMPLNFTPGSPFSYSDVTAYTAENFPAPLSGLDGTYVNDLIYTPTTGGVWAYQFFPVNAANNANDLPKLVFELNVTDTDGSIENQQFISVDRFEDKDTSEEITNFKPNHIYKIANLKFANRNLNPEPNVTLNDVTVTVEVIEWIDVNVNPIV